MESEERQPMRLKTQRILAALLSLVLLLALAPAGWADEEIPGAPAGEGGTGEEQEIIPDCYVQIIPSGNQEYMEDLKTADIVVDVYKVANMTKSKQYDTYEFTATTAFAGADDGTIVALVKDIQDRLEDSEIDREKWELLAEGALEVVKDNPGTIIQYQRYPANSDGIADLTGITQGLYLVVAHTKNLEDYLRTIKAGNSYTYLDANGNPVQVTESYDRTVSIAETSLYEYSFAAQLIAIPTKAPDENGIIKTSNSGPWLLGESNNPLKYILKPNRGTRNGDLRIVKTLNTFAGPEPASFVFQITWNEKKEVRYVEITFSEAGTREYVLEKEIPVGTEVTVTEEHTGLQYKLVSGGGTVTIAAPEDVANDNTKLATVTFVNDHDNPGGGYGVVNRFTADGQRNFVWKGKPLYDSNEPAAEHSGEGDE